MKISTHPSASSFKKTEKHVDVLIENLEKTNSELSEGVDNTRDNINRVTKASAGLENNRVENNKTAEKIVVGEKGKKIDFKA